MAIAKQDFVSESLMYNTLSISLAHLPLLC